MTLTTKIYCSRQYVGINQKYTLLKKIRGTLFSKPVTF
jgi:hypothetical protein